jgi:hypothetical protein
MHKVKVLFLSLSNTEAKGGREIESQERQKEENEGELQGMLP